MIHSFYDVGEACEKLAYYNFVNHCYDGRVNRWLRAVTSGTNFANANNNGNANNWDASNVNGVCPIIEPCALVDQDVVAGQKIRKA